MNAVITMQRGTNPMKGYLRTKEVAERFNVHPRTIIRWVQDGNFPGVRKLNPTAKNSPFLIPITSVEQFESEQLYEPGRNDNHSVQ